MEASKVDCLVTQIEYLSPHILRVRFQPSNPISFLPGQFLSVVIPGVLRNHKPQRRCYSFAINPGLSQAQGYEICVKLVKGGVGSEFLRELTVGDRFKALAPFGDFILPAKTDNRNACFISTGTGIAPFRSMLGSVELTACNYQSVSLLHGVRHESDLVFTKDFHRAGVECHFVVSQPSLQWAGAKGRVTDLLRRMTQSRKLSDTDFFICGNGDMVEAICEALISVYGVDRKCITCENFSAKQKKAA